MSKQYLGLQEDRTLPAGTIVSALLIADLQAMPLVEGVPGLQPKS